MGKRYEIVYSKRQAMAIWETTLEKAKARAEMLRRAGYKVDIWEHSKSGCCHVKEEGRKR